MVMESNTRLVLHTSGFPAYQENETADFYCCIRACQVLVTITIYGLATPQSLVLESVRVVQR